MKDLLGDRMKTYYENRTRYFLPRRTYTIIRLDGKAFHTLTKHFIKPFNDILIDIMNKTAIELCKQIQGAKFAYVQSDEISILLTDFDTLTTQAWFDGNIQKIVSVSASIATVNFFNSLIYFIWNDRIKKIDACFDSRVFTIPNNIEVENYFVWRQKDWIRNSINMYAQSTYSHKELNGKSIIEVKKMLKTKDLDWDDLKQAYKYGRLIYKDELVSGNWAIKAAEQWYPSFDDYFNRKELIDNIPILK